MGHKMVRVGARGSQGSSESRKNVEGNITYLYVGMKKKQVSCLWETLLLPA